MKKNSGFGIISLLCSIVLALIPFVLLPVCHSGIELQNGSFIPMKCHWMGIVEVIFAVLMIINSLIGILLKPYPQKKIIPVQGIILSVMLILTSTVFIGFCANPTMECRMGTQPAVLIFAVVNAAVNLLWFLRLGKAALSD